MTGSDELERVLEVPDAAAMHALGRRFGESAPPGSLLLLDGPLGVGKTTFAQGVGAGCGVEEPITSPTYNLILQYRGRRPFTHVDLYRLEDPAALESLDMDEILESEGIICVEWPRLLADRARPPSGWIRIAPGGAGLASGRSGGPATRSVELRCRGDGWEALGARLPRGPAGAAEPSRPS